MSFFCARGFLFEGALLFLFKMLDIVDSKNYICKSETMQII